jgi:UDP-glucose:(heptosyl)LPS alpha-1,3-glucosyltransferase
MTGKRQAAQPSNPALSGIADLRLAVVSPFVDRCHGTERALAELLERLARDYHCEIHLYAQRVEDLSVAKGKSADSSETGRIVWHQVPSIPGPHLVKFLGWMFANEFLRFWHRVFRRASFDLTLSPGINCLTADIIIVHAVFHRLNELAREKGAGDTRTTGFFREMHRRAYYALLTGLESLVYSNPKTVLAAVSQRTADLLERYFQRSDVRVIPNGVDTRAFSPSACAARRRESRRRLMLRDTDFVLLFVGNDWRVKGVPLVLEVMAQLAELPLQFLVVGSDDADRFRETAKRFGVLDRCHWESPRRDVIEFYAAADTYVSPSREDSFALPVAEAMACGLPAITSAYAGVSASIHNSVDGFVLREPEDTPSLARIIERLYRDTAFRRSVGEAAARTARQWTWDRSAAQAWELVESLARTRDRRDASPRTRSA